MKVLATFFIYALPFGLLWTEVVCLWEGRNGRAVHKPEQHGVWKLISSPGHSINRFRYCALEAYVLHRALGPAWDLEHKGIKLWNKCPSSRSDPGCMQSKPTLSRSVNVQHGGKGGQQLIGTKRSVLFNWVPRGSTLLDTYEDSPWKCHFSLIWGFKYCTRWHWTQINVTEGPWGVWGRKKWENNGRKSGRITPSNQKEADKTRHMLHANKSCRKSW